MQVGKFPPISSSNPIGSPQLRLESKRQGAVNDGPITCYLLPSRFPVSRPRWHRLRRSHYREPSGNLAHPQQTISKLAAALLLPGFFEIEPRRVTATLPKIAIGLSRVKRLLSATCCSARSYVTPGLASYLAIVLLPRLLCGWPRPARPEPRQTGRSTPN